MIILLKNMKTLEPNKILNFSNFYLKNTKYLRNTTVIEVISFFLLTQLLQ